MIRQMEYIDGYQFVRREDFAKMTREELQTHLEARGFAVFDHEPLEQLIEAAQSDFDDEYFG